MAYDLMLWFIRSLLFIGIAPNLGPKLVMIRKMTNDLLFFIFLMIVVIFGYGIASRAMIAYGTFNFDGRQFFRNVVYPVYYFMLGSFDNELESFAATPDDSTTIATQIMFIFYLLFVNILLINLLTAMFTFTTAHVHEQANYVWAYDRCAFIRDYYARPALFPPFTFLITIVQLCRWYWLMIPANFHVDNAWSEFERYSTNDYIRQLLAAQTDATTNIVTTDLTSESLTTDADEPKRFKLDINQWKDDFTRAQIDTSGRLSSMESTIAKLERQIEQMYQYFERA
ncbi:unnamed protein product, partial [Rotaria sp. Silwood2]